MRTSIQTDKTNHQKRGSQWKPSPSMARAIKRQRDNVKLLASYQPFQDEIKKARAWLNIPEDGFGSSDEEAHKKWFRSMLRKSDEVMDINFSKQVREIHGKVTRNEISEEMGKKQSALLHIKVPVNYLRHISKFIIEKFNLPENYEDFVRSYIMNNDGLTPIYNFGIGPFTDPATWRDVRHIPVTVYASLSDDDLVALKQEINNWIKFCSKKSFPRLQALVNIDKKLTIEKWYSNKIRQDIITKKDYKVTASEIAEDVLGDRNETGKVYDTLRTVKKLREKRFGKH